MFERNRKRIRSRRTERTTFARNLVRGVLSLIALGILLFGIYHLTHMQAFTIQSIDISGGVTIDHAPIEDRVEAELRGSYWRLVPRTFAFTYPRERIARIVASDPRIYGVEVEREGFTALTIRFEEYIPHALLCPRSTENPCYFISNDGFAFEEASSLVGGALVRHIEEEREMVRRGDTIPIERLRSIEEFIKALHDELALRIGTVTYTGAGDILFGINGGGMIKVDGKKELATAFDDVRTVLAAEEYSHIAPGNFQYIDVRFPPKVFVNETLAPAATTTEDIATTTVVDI